MPTYLDEKNATSNVLGRTDGGTSNLLRDNAINNVRQNEIANAYPFSWLRKTVTLTTDTDGQIDLPSDYNISHRPYDIRIVNSSTGDDNVFTQIDPLVYDSLLAQNYVYFIDRNTSTNLWQLNTHNPSTALKVIYYHTPVTLSADADIDIIPDLDVIAHLAAARYWLSSERDETNYERFKNLGEQKLQYMVKLDKRSNPLRPTRSSLHRVNLGFN
jgi:hypothetical protein